MSLGSNPDARVYYVPARRRLEDAKILLDNHRRDGARSMAGFAVECLLKALVLANSTPRQRPKPMIRLTAEIGHDLDALRKEVADRGLNLEHFYFPSGGNIVRITNLKLGRVAGRKVKML
ncbi:MAG TPA: HEPN domain-containing protein [Urbifossiella sp.]|jgi:HEPN domain-containing protein|nr:HEPN domain-containing protein [Urbifossiella sp.]